MKRDAVLQVRVTQEEKEHAEVLAEEFSMKVSDYARMCIFVGPTPTRDELLEVDADDLARPTPELLPERGPKGEHVKVNDDETGHSFVVPDDTSREAFLRFLYERITELHRDKRKRWPGVTARHKAGEDWKLVREGKPLEKIEPREMEDALIVTPTTYRTA